MLQLPLARFDFPATGVAGGEAVAVKEESRAGRSMATEVSAGLSPWNKYEIHIERLLDVDMKSEAESV
jgi:hypothetical protein